MNLQTIRQQFERKRGQQQQKKLDLVQAISEQDKIKKEISISEKAQAVIIAVAMATQEELQYRIAEPVSLALASVYDNPYLMNVRFDITGRGTTECHLGFERNGHIIKPLEASGGGPVDIASFALRIGSWSLAQPRSRPILILDEPFRFVSRNKMPLAGQMLKEISKQLGLQIIMVTHISELIECGDRILNVQIHNGISELVQDG
ncbi:MAG: hypothetical protein KKD77_21870 [Gammaproteobacteria bacterium]|nr:hypothetical protein [Gammaproteobacteria bacterium]